VREFVRGVVENTPLGREGTADLLLAVTEVFNNAVEHAHRFDASRQVVIRIHRRPDAVEVEVQDEGPGFTPPDVKVPSHVLPTQRGLGLFLARSLVDEVTFKHGPGTTVRLVKRFSCS
ncbi:MAG: ATP-binding protein, partial [Armatimonadota bacterium]|nr:ATP-binding protein [Armatimonadota bacterium]